MIIVISFPPNAGDVISCDTHEEPDRKLRYDDEK